jgi:hypothetical protein
MSTEVMVAAVVGAAAWQAFTVFKLLMRWLPLTIKGRLDEYDAMEKRFSKIHDSQFAWQSFPAPIAILSGLKILLIGLGFVFIRELVLEVLFDR